MVRQTSAQIIRTGPITTLQPQRCKALARLKQAGCAAVRVAGVLPDLSCAIAIVGTRYASQEALAYTERLACQLVQTGCTVISGGALGIDAAAHRGALSAPQTVARAASTVAVLGTGLRAAYPPQHGPLFSEIAQGKGALLTETMDDEIVPRKGVFIRRNRIIAALSTAVVVVQAPERSGALSTARFALKYQRPVWIVPGTPWDPRSVGNLAFFAKYHNRGAYLLTDVKTMLAQLGYEQNICKNMPSTVSTQRVHDGDGVSPVERLVRAVSGRALEANEIIDETGLRPDQVHTSILDALLADRIVEVMPGRYLSKTQ